MSSISHRISQDRLDSWFWLLLCTVVGWLCDWTVHDEKFRNCQGADFKGFDRWKVFSSQIKPPWLFAFFSHATPTVVVWECGGVERITHRAPSKRCNIHLTVVTLGTRPYFVFFYEKINPETQRQTQRQRERQRQRQRETERLVESTKSACQNVHYTGNMFRSDGVEPTKISIRH